MHRQVVQVLANAMEMVELIFHELQKQGFLSEEELLELVRMCREERGGVL